MATLDKRLCALEGQRTSSELRGLGADQLDARLCTLPTGSAEMFRVMVAAIQRRGSRLPLATFNKAR